MRIVSLLQEIPSGIQPFDIQGGLVKGTLNLLQTEDHQSGVVATGHFLKAGLARGERVGLIAFDNAATLLRIYTHYGFSFEEHLESEQLIYLYYKGTVSHSLCFTAHYSEVIDEILHLSGGHLDRLAVCRADALINPQSLTLARESVQNLVSATTNIATTIFGYYCRSEHEQAQNVDLACRSFLLSYLSLTGSGPQDSYTLRWKVSPFPMKGPELTLTLREGHGFIQEARAQRA